MHIPRIILLTTLLLSFGSAYGQQDVASPKNASNLFDAGKFQDAKVAYKALLDKYSRNPEYNYYYGVTLFQTKDDYSEAIRRIRFATSAGVTKDANFYLGRLFQLTYEFTEAKKNYIEFKRGAALGDVRVQNATKFIQECDFGMQNSSKLLNITVSDKDTTNKNDILSLYRLTKSNGNILKNSDFFESGVDPNGIMYINSRQDEAYFSLFSTNSKGQDIYTMVKLLDGWSDNDVLPSNINTAFDEVYPFKTSNNSTLYFASNKPGGYGGFDIYKTDYNVATKTYSNPVNLGLPINSPDDDFLFVQDDATSTVWFASNRETMGDNVMVYKVNWPSTPEKRAVLDLQDIRNAAKLDVSVQDLKAAQLKGEYTYQSEMAKDRTAPKFSFYINDTLTYTRFEQFKSNEALSYYKKGYETLQKRDSLNNKMREKRAFFQMSDEDAVKDKMVIDILKMEKVLYEYDDAIEEDKFIARRLEIDAIKEQVSSGNYQSNSASKTQSHIANFELTPNKYQFYSQDAFDSRARKYAPMYENVFDDTDISQLEAADTLYVWGSILTLEASSLLDKAAHSTQPSELKFKKTNSQTATSTTDMLLNESKQMKEASLSYLLSSLDQKYSIYSMKLGELIPQIRGDVGQRFAADESKANSYYREAASLYSSNNIIEPTQIEQIIGLKKMAVDTQDKILFDYLKSSKEGWTLTPAVAVATQKPKSVGSYIEPTPKAPSKPVVDKSASTINNDGLVYKIQIGVFKNKPSEEMLSALPTVTYEVIVEKNVIKYFSGKYSTADEALANIQYVKDSGFPGAFLVAFNQGKQIDLNTAKSLEK